MQTKAQLPHLSQEYSSPWDNIYPYSEIGRWVVDTTTADFKYKLDRLDSSKKLDGSASVLDGTDGDVMVKIPRFGYKVEFNEDGTNNWYISTTIPNATGSNLPDGFVIHPAFRRGDGTYAEYFLYGAFLGHSINTQLRSVSGVLPTGRKKTISALRTEARNGRNLAFGISHYNMISALQLLYLCEFQNTNSQTVLGKGKTLTTESNIVTGDSISLGDRSGYVNSGRGGNGEESVVYRGVEDFFGALFQMQDGILVTPAGYLYTEKPQFFGNPSYSDFIEIATPTSSGYFKNTIQKTGFEQSFLPKTHTGGTATTYYADYVYSSAYTGNRICLFGTYWADDLIAGAFCVALNFTDSISGGDIGVRLSYLQGGNV